MQTLFNNSKNLVIYVINLTTRFYHKKSVLGVMLLFFILIQCLSGIMLAFYYVSECMLVPFAKNEEEMMDLYNDDFLYIHERLVDFIFIFMYLHMYRKLSYNVYNKAQINAWVSGATLWLLIHFSIFFGLTLSCTHLSDVTLTIAANIMSTFTFKTGKVYWILFTNKTLNTDTVIRIAYIHYIISLIILFLSMFHAIEMHYDWKNHLMDDGVEVSLLWLFYVVKDEINFFINILIFFYLAAQYFYECNEPLSYEIFMWGDIGFNNEIRFLGVAPHWYFRAYMGWLIVCPHHYIGVFGLVLYMGVIYFQVYIKKILAFLNSNTSTEGDVEKNLFHFIIFVVFIMCLVYTSSILPYGKYYNRIEGNSNLLYSYFFVLMYVTKLINSALYKVNLIFKSIIK